MKLDFSIKTITHSNQELQLGGILRAGRLEENKILQLYLKNERLLKQPIQRLLLGESQQLVKSIEVEEAVAVTIVLSDAGRGSHIVARLPFRQITAHFNPQWNRFNTFNFSAKIPNIGNRKTSVPINSIVVKRAKSMDEFSIGWLPIEEELHFTAHIQKTKKLGLCLQGGGLKGCFTVGALKYLQTAGILSTNKTLTLSSASTGSITSVLLAENGPDSVDKAIEQYTKLRIVEDMFEFRPRLKQLIKEDDFIKQLIAKVFEKGEIPDLDLGTFVRDQLLAKAKEGFSDAANDWGAIGAGLLLGGPLGAGLVFVLRGLGNTVDEVGSTVKRLKKIWDIKQSLALLTPVEKKLEHAQDGINHQLLNKRIITRKTQLHLAVTSMNTGATCYITEREIIQNGQKQRAFVLLYPTPGKKGEGFDYSAMQKLPIVALGSSSTRVGKTVTNSTNSINRKEVYMEGALISGAFPSFFEPRTIQFIRDGVEIEELFNDGGIRENAPLEMLMKTGSTHNIIIHNGDFTDDKIPMDAVKEYRWSSVMGNSLGWIDRENNRTDISKGRAINTQLNGNDQLNAINLHIAPTFPTIGLTEINPVSIATTIWYGYMRAYEELLIADQRATLDIDTINRLRNNSEDIYVCLKAFYAMSAQLIKTCLYRVNVIGRSGHFEYVTYNHSDDGDNWEIKPLDNRHNIKYTAFNMQVLHRYLELKEMFLDLIEARLTLTKRLDATHFRRSIMAGVQGMIQQAIVADWYGVYSRLNQMHIALNKRAHLKSQFLKHQPFGKNYRPYSRRRYIAGPNHWNPLVYGEVNRRVRSWHVKKYFRTDDKVQIPPRLNTHTDKGEIYGVIQKIHNKLKSLNDSYGVRFEGEAFFDQIAIFHNDDQAYYDDWHKESVLD